MWDDIARQWQIVFDEAWKAFCHGSTPIGAALYDRNGELVLSDRNRSREKDTINREISHAEANALRRLDTAKYNSRELTMYTSMEPCPMCMGMILMGHIKEVHYAAKDLYCGMVHLTDTEPYYRIKKVNCSYDGGEKEYFQLTVQSYYELRHLEKGASDKVIRQFNETNAAAVNMAKKLYLDKTLDRLAEEGTPCGEVYDMIVSCAWDN